MTVAAGSLQYRTRSSIAWWIWMVLQWATLAVFAARVPLSAGFPMPVENSAAAAMAAVQILMAIVLAPALLARWRDVAIALAGGAVMAAAAHRLAGDSLLQGVASLGVLLLWLAALRFAPTWLRATFALLSIAGPMIALASAESDARWIDAAIIWSPTLSAGRVALQHSTFATTILLPIFSLLLNTATVVQHRLITARQVIHNTPTA